MRKNEHLGFYKPHRLPHLDLPNTIQFITFVLADAAPKNRLPIIAKAKTVPGDRYFEQFDSDLDRGKGSCLLGNRHLASLVLEAILANAAVTHIPVSWVVMPNHVHVLTRQLPGATLARVVRQLKSGSALYVNRFLNQSGALWQKGYFDRAIRDISHLENTINYIHMNPCKAGLVKNPLDWQASSIHGYSQEDAMQKLFANICESQKQ